MMTERIMGPGRRLQIVSAIGMLCVNLVVVGVSAGASQSSKGLKEIYGYSCCGGSFGKAPYHPGEVVKVDWIRTAVKSSNKPAKTVSLSVKASGPYPSISALKKAFTKPHPAYGKVNFAAATLRISDEKAASPVSMLRVPNNAGAGFYEISITVVKGKSSVTSGGIITIVH
jgi:hypothetical protein